METLRNIKNQQRSQCLTARRNLSDAERAAYSHAICQTLMTLEAVIRAETIFSYMATWDEVDLSGFTAESEGVVNRPATVNIKSPSTVWAIEEPYYVQIKLK